MDVRALPLIPLLRFISCLFLSLILHSLAHFFSVSLYSLFLSCHLLPFESRASPLPLSFAPLNQQNSYCSTTTPVTSFISFNHHRSPASYVHCVGKEIEGLEELNDTPKIPNSVGYSRAHVITCAHT